MSKVAHFRHFQTVRYSHAIEQKGEDSWWVIRQEIGFDGKELPFGRIVFFARSEEEATAWLENQRQDTAEKQDLALTA